MEYQFSLLFDKYYAISCLLWSVSLFPALWKILCTLISNYGACKFSLLFEKMLSTFTSNIERVTFTCSLKNIMHFYLYYGACHFSLLFEKKYAIYMTSPNNQMLFFCYFNGTAFDNDIEKKSPTHRKKVLKTKIDICLCQENTSQLLFSWKSNKHLCVDLGINVTWYRDSLNSTIFVAGKHRTIQKIILSIQELRISPLLV